MVRSAVLACWLLAGCDLVFPVGGGPSADGPVVSADAPAGCGSLRLWLDFESPGFLTAIDGSGCGNDAVIVDAFPAPSHDGGTSIDINLDSIVTVPETGLLDFPGPFTLAAWVYIEDTDPSAAFGWIMRNILQYGMYFVSGGDFHCELGSGITASTSVPYNSWSHVACTFDGSATIAYVDGSGLDCVAQSPRADVGGVGTSIGNGGPMIEALDAFIDDVRIYDRTLTPEEICDLAGQTGCVSVACPL